MGYTESQAEAIANQIYRRFGYRIHIACQDSDVEESFLAGFIGVEAGKDKKTGQINEFASRFEPHVYQKLLALRDGLRSFYQNIRREQIADATDEALKALSRSYQLTQIMGWHIINSLKCSLADLKSPELHLHFAVQLLQLTGGNFLKRRDYGSVLRIWNTGSANGKTYHADYVDNALKVKKYYVRLLVQKGLPLPSVSESPIFKETEFSESTPVFQPLPPVSLPQTEQVSEPIPENLTQTTVKTDSIEVTSSTVSAEIPTKDFTAFIPQIDTARRWLKGLVGGSTFLSVIAYLANAPLWLQILSASLVVVIVIGVITIFALYHKEIFAYVTAMNTLRATNGADNPILTTEKE